MEDDQHIILLFLIIGNQTPPLWHQHTHVTIFKETNINNQHPFGSPQNETHTHLETNCLHCNDCLL